MGLANFFIGEVAQVDEVREVGEQHKSARTVRAVMNEGTMLGLYVRGG